jgi:hypothetical protein
MVSFRPIRSQGQANSLQSPILKACLSDFVALILFLCPCLFPTEWRPDNPASNVSFGLLAMSKFLEFCAICAFSRPFPLIAAGNSSNRATSSTLPANFSSSVSIFTPATLPTPVGQMLSNRNYFAHDA